MTDKVILIVLAAALLHAIWNAVVKGSDDKIVSMMAVVLGHAPCALLALFFVEAPLAASWGWLLLGMTLHVGYQLFLVKAYNYGDLSQVYPIARGVAPLLVTLISVLFLSAVLNDYQLAAIVLIAAGIISVCLVRKNDGALNGAAVILALITGAFIAGYSLVDGFGARLSGSAIGYYSWGDLTPFYAPGHIKRCCKECKNNLYFWWRRILRRLCLSYLGLYPSPHRVSHCAARNQYSVRFVDWCVSFKRETQYRKGDFNNDYTVWCSNAAFF